MRRIIIRTADNSSLNGVEKERIGACGISMGGGYMLQLSAFDRRVKAVAIEITSSGTLIIPESSNLPKDGKGRKDGVV